MGPALTPINIRLRDPPPVPVSAQALASTSRAMISRWISLVPS